VTSKLNSDGIAGLLTVASAISSMTTQVTRLCVCLSALGAASQSAARQIEKLSRSATQLAMSCQDAGTYCHCEPNNASNSSAQRSTQSSIEHAFFFGATVLGAAQLWNWAGRALVPFIPLVTAKTLMNAIREWTLSLSRAVSQLEFVATVLEGAAASLAALTTTEAGLAIGGAAIVGGMFYLLWRRRYAAMRAIQRFSSMIADETGMLLVRVASAVGEGVGRASNGISRGLGYRKATPKAPPPPNRFRSENRVRNNKTRILSLPSLMRPEVVGLATNHALRNSAAAMLLAPLLTTPASARLGSSGPRVDRPTTTSVVINSSPTIAVNGPDCADVEERVIEALKKHREELYLLWCGELQRRQRTEF